MSTSATTKAGINAALLAELQHEGATTKTVLERVPADKFDWKPHEKSMTFSRLATHVAEMFNWIKVTLETDVLDFAKEEFKPFEPKTTEELVEYLEKTLAEATEALKNASDETFFQTWTMRNGEQVYFEMPKIQVIRSFCYNHIYHHRGQLSVYLRLNDIPVPSIYGPSADEGQM
ncbi:MAG: DinB family protein [Pyrinomonadaceae bacterium]